MSKVMRYIKGGFFTFELIDGGYETFQAYREGKDWAAEATKTGLKIVASYGVPYVIESGILALLGFTPVGWVAIIGVAVVEAASIVATDHLIERYL